MKRRHFIQQSLATGAGFSALPLLGAVKPFARYRLGLIGSGWWGMNILGEAMAHGACDVVALCDVDQNQLRPALEKVEKLTGKKPKAYTDYRELILNEKPDIVIVATPDHWHALPTIEAVSNGAHVYVEKPIGHTLKEGSAMVAAARKYGKMVQVGTHRRVSPHNVSALEFLRSGKVGKVHRVHCFVNYDGGPGQKTPDVEAPAGLDWDMWIGPAPYRPYNPSMHPKGFRQYLDFANGTIGDWGIHWFDQVLWWTEEKYPKRIFSTGDRFVKQDGSDAPDTQSATFVFEDFILTWEHKLNAREYNEPHHIGCYFHGTEGTLHIGWLDGWTFYPRNKDHQIIKVEPQLNQPDNQNIQQLWANFMQSIENPNQLPYCDIYKGHLSTNLSLLAMISMKTGQSLDWDGEKEVILNSSQANKLLERDYRGPWKYPSAG